MNTTLILVSSIDGKTTRENSKTHEWASKEDQEFFQGLIETNNLIVMGSKTYENAKEHIILKQDKLRIVLTRSLEKYADQTVNGQLEFSAEEPKDLISRLEKAGYKNLLLVGGEQTNDRFFTEGLVDEFYLTIEPKIFGKGKSIVSNSLHIPMELISIQQLNTQGSILLHYKILK